MVNNFLVILPPFIVIILAFITRRIKLSLLAGIITGGLIAGSFSLMPSIEIIYKRFITVTEVGYLASWDTFWVSGDKIFLCLFLTLLGILIVLLQRSGGAYAFGAFITKKLKSARDAERSSLILSLFFFIDDYFSSITVGSVMQPITDRFKISRVKIGVLAAALAGPMTVLVPLSSWMAYILGQYASAGISLDDTSGLITCEPLYAYISTIPFLFYPIIILGTFWFIVHKRVSFGIVANHEKCASTTGNLFGGKQPVIHSEKAHANTEHTSWWWDFLFPMTLFISLVIFGSLYGGGYYLLGGTRGLFDTIQNANIQAALFVGVSFTILFTILFFIARKKIKSSQLRSIILEGIKILGPTTITLLLIWTFAGLVRYDLYTGQYIATQLHTKLHLIHASLFPAIFFVSSALIAFMMGSAWGTMGVLFPIGVPMLISILNLQAPIALVQVPLLAPLLGAIISGSIVGSNSSILSDVVFMTSSSAGIYHLDLVRAMVSYITPTAISSTLAYIFVGYFILYIPQAPAVILSITLGFVINILIFYLLRRLTK